MGKLNWSLTLCILIGMALSACTNSNVKPNEINSEQPPNVLFILTDNQAASLIGTYGNPDIKTPHMDKLAKSGVKFTSAFAVNGMCSPTRATLMTGLMPSQHGLHNWLDDEQMENWPRDWSAIAEYRTLPYALSKNGYQTALIGKWHLGQPWQASIGYQHWLTFTAGHTLDFWNNTIVENDKTYDVKDKHVVEFFADKAIEYIQSRDTDKPFYLQLNLDGPYVNPPTNMGPAKNNRYPEYENAELKSFPRTEVSSNYTDQLGALLEAGRENEFETRMLQSVMKMSGDHATRANIASQNAYVDDQVGRVLDALADLGYAKNTLIILSSDQGNFYGQHGLWTHTTLSKPTNLYEAALHIPLIFSHEGAIEQGRISDQLIGQYDIPATILDYVGIESDFVDSPGRSFAPLLSQKNSTPPQDNARPIFYEQEETRGIRTRDFAYWKTIEGLGSPSLFDMQSDPGQTQNLTNNPTYTDVISELDTQLEHFFEEYSNPRYDLWKGGVAKGSVLRPDTFKQLYGSEWETESEIKPVYKTHQ